MYKHAAMNENTNNSRPIAVTEQAPHKLRLPPDVCQCRAQTVLQSTKLCTVSELIVGPNTFTKCLLRCWKLNFVVWTLSDTMKSKQERKKACGSLQLLIRQQNIVAPRMWWGGCKPNEKPNHAFTGWHTACCWEYQIHILLFCFASFNETRIKCCHGFVCSLFLLWLVNIG